MADENAVESWVRATHEISVRYQPAADGRSWASDLRRRRYAAPAPAPAQGDGAGAKSRPPVPADAPVAQDSAGERAY